LVAAVAAGQELLEGILRVVPLVPVVLGCNIVFQDLLLIMPEEVPEVVVQY
jgi:hypothetical protein